MSVFGPFGDLPEPTEATYAEGRYTTRTYASRTFTTEFGRKDVRSRERHTEHGSSR